MIRWTMVPIGQVDLNPKYLSACGPNYSSYNDCLRKTLFDKDECQPKLHELTVCEKTNDLFEMDKKLAILRSFKKRKPKVDHGTEIHADDE